MQRCQCITKDNTQCTRMVKNGTLCYQHKDCTNLSKSRMYSIPMADDWYQTFINGTVLYHNDRENTVTTEPPKDAKYFVNDEEIPFKCIKPQYLPIYELTSGTYGIILLSCIDKTNCQYVIKFQNLEPDLFDREMTISYNMSNAKIAPKIIDAWTCPLRLHHFVLGFMVFEQWEGALDENEIPHLSQEIINKLKSLVKKMHALGVYHGDLLPKNILVKRDNNGKIIDVSITDWGTAHFITQSDTEFLATLYNYHLDENNVTHHYVKDKNIYEILANPTLLDDAFIYYVDNVIRYSPPSSA